MGEEGAAQVAAVAAGPVDRDLGDLRDDRLLVLAGGLPAGGGERVRHELDGQRRQDRRREGQDGRVEARLAAELVDLARPPPQQGAGAAGVGHEVERVGALSGAGEDDDVVLWPAAAPGVRAGR